MEILELLNGDIRSLSKEELREVSFKYLGGYYHFGSKDKLLDSILSSEKYIQEQRELVEETFNGYEDELIKCGLTDIDREFEIYDKETLELYKKDIHTLSKVELVKVSSVYTCSNYCYDTSYTKGRLIRFIKSSGRYKRKTNGGIVIDPNESIFNVWDREREEYKKEIHSKDIRSLTKEELTSLSSEYTSGWYDIRVTKKQILDHILESPKYIQEQRELTIEKILN